MTSTCSAGMKGKTNPTLQSMKNANFSQPGFCHCHENGLIHAIPTIFSNLYVGVKFQLFPATYMRVSSRFSITLVRIKAYPWLIVIHSKGNPTLKTHTSVVEYRWNRPDRPDLMAGIHSLLIDNYMRQRLESCAEHFQVMKWSISNSNYYICFQRPASAAFPSQQFSQASRVFLCSWETVYGLLHNATRRWRCTAQIWRGPSRWSRGKIYISKSKREGSRNSNNLKVWNFDAMKKRLSPCAAWS